MDTSMYYGHRSTPAPPGPCRGNSSASLEELKQWQQSLVPGEVIAHGLKSIPFAAAVILAIVEGQVHLDYGVNWRDLELQPGLFGQRWVNLNLLHPLEWYWTRISCKNNREGKVGPPTRYLFAGAGTKRPARSDEVPTPHLSPPSSPKPLTSSPSGEDDASRSSSKRRRITTAESSDPSPPQEIHPDFFVDLLTTTFKQIMQYMDWLKAKKEAAKRRQKAAQVEKKQDEVQRQRATVDAIQREIDARAQQWIRHLKPLVSPQEGRQRLGQCEAR